MATTLALFATGNFFESVEPGKTETGTGTELEVVPYEMAARDERGEEIWISEFERLMEPTPWADLKMGSQCVLGKNRKVPYYFETPLEAFAYAHKNYGLVAFYVDGLQLWPLPGPEPVDGERAGEEQSERRENRY